MSPWSGSLLLVSVKLRPNFFSLGYSFKATSTLFCGHCATCKSGCDTPTPPPRLVFRAPGGGGACAGIVKERMHKAVHKLLSF